SSPLLSSLSLHDALPIYFCSSGRGGVCAKETEAFLAWLVGAFYCVEGILGAAYLGPFFLMFVVQAVALWASVWVLYRAADASSRSEEHTSELQSPYDLVC